MKPEWTGIERTPEKICPICGKKDWCQITTDGSVVRCMRVESSKEIKGRDGSIGWLHSLKEDIRPKLDKVVRKKKAPKLSPARWSELAMGFRAGVDLTSLSGELGVSVRSLERLEYGQGLISYSEDKPARRAWTAPMRDGCENIIGIRTRHAGFKGSYPGSQNGLCIPDEIGHKEITIVEGYTDPAALLDIGVDCIGRATCSSNVEDVKIFFERHKTRRVVILSDNDTAKIRPDGSKWYPGQEGTLRLANSLPYNQISVYIIKPVRCKDAREWLQKGLTAEMYENLVRNTRRYLG